MGFLHIAYESDLLPATSNTSQSYLHVSRACWGPHTWLLSHQGRSWSRCKIRSPSGCWSLWLTPGWERTSESCGLSGCVSAGRKRACRGWRPAAAGWPGGFRRGAERWPRRPGPTRGRHCGQMDALEGDGWRSSAAGCSPFPCLHHWSDPTHILNKGNRGYWVNTANNKRLWGQWLLKCSMLNYYKDNTLNQGVLLQVPGGIWKILEYLNSFGKKMIWL